MLSHYPARDVEEPVTKDVLTRELALTRMELREEMADLREKLRGEMGELREKLGSKMDTQFHLLLGVMIVMCISMIAVLVTTVA